MPGKGGSGEEVESAGQAREGDVHLKVKGRETKVECQERDRCERDAEGVGERLVESRVEVL